MSIYIGDKEIKNLFVGGSTSVSDMQGPCPDGFHVPTKDEWTTVYNILDGLDASYMRTLNYVKTYLKLPPNGYLTPDTARSYELGTSCWYWSCEKNGNYSGYCIYCDNGLAFNVTNMYSGYGLPIRPFKDGVVNPISTGSTLKSGWTWLYHSGSNNYGIAHNSSDGIISLSSDGTTWITMADKNVGATTVYNNGDSQTEDNCGKAYQRGNNYGFPITGTSGAISGPVDASAYGPGNYYSSGFVITNYSASYNWDSSYNKNLRGGVTQGTTEKGAVKAVYLGENKVRPAYKPRTFTITRTEKSDMSSGWTYSDDAVGLTAGDTAFDEFFGYYGCRLNTSGQETATITQEQSGGAGKLDITQLGTLTSGDNVMIAFPVMGIKMSKSGSTVTLSITKELNKSGYQYYAHSTGTLSNPGTPKDVFYLGAYKGYSSSSVIKSWSGKSPTTKQTQATFCTRAKANGSGYNIIGFYQRMFVNCLYMMKYGSPDSQTKVGKGYTGGSAAVNTGGTNSQTNATYGTTSTTVQAKLFGLEDWWGNIDELVGGMCTDSSKNLWTALSGFTGAITTSSPYENTGTTIQTTSGNDLSSIVGSNKGLFATTATVSNSSYNTYYCDNVGVDASRLAIAGGIFSGDSGAGAFHLYVNQTATNARTYVGCRLMYLNGLT